jgi:hypothetical protein
MLCMVEEGKAEAECAQPLCKRIEMQTCSLDVPVITGSRESSMQTLGLNSTMIWCFLDQKYEHVKAEIVTMIHMCSQMYK